MKGLLTVCILAAVSCPRAAAMSDDDLLDAAISTETVAGEAAAGDEELLATIQESDEDLAGFVQDYVGKDSALKGAFFLEDKSADRVLKLALVSVRKKSSEGPDNSKVVEAVFRGPGDNKYPVLFHIQSAGFGGIDIFRIELKKAEPNKGTKAKNK